MELSASPFLEDETATDRLGSVIAAMLEPGDTILLDGEIGAGKSHLARAAIQAMYRTAGLAPVEVSSPTYTIVQTYDLPNASVWHADLYRLADGSETHELGLDDAFGVDIVMIEWPDRLFEAPSDALQISLASEGLGRRVHLSSPNARWKALFEEIDGLDA